ncbi:MAG TPA: hypothetical protein VFW34_02505 [Candidatus Rubrimentiphilum sp.]|nr:hypothetical protein [Candidatus Rubrimentiphilum sp.]
MATFATSSGAVRAAFGGLIDYAGLFPPAQLGMETALAEYAAARSGPHAWMLERFIVPESRLNELLQFGPAPFPLSVIAATADDSRTWFAAVQASLQRIAAHRETGVSIEAIELPLPRPLSQRETYDAAIGQYSAALARSGLADLPSYMELPQHDRRNALLPGALASMKRHRLRAKLRCGGVTASSIPPVYDIVTFLRTAAEERVAFKATAGLHHPVRAYNEESGFVMHGFLNVLTAAALVRQGADEDTVVASLEDEDAGHFALDRKGLRWRGTTIDEDALRGTRADGFQSYGSCSFSEPVDDLVALGFVAS